MLTAGPPIRSKSRELITTLRERIEEVGLVASTRRGKYKVLEFAGAGRIEAAAAWLDRLTETDTDLEPERS